MNNTTGARVKPRPGGMSLVEVLAATLVLAIGCLAVLNLQASTMQSGSAANHMTVAAFLAESQIEWLQSLVFNYDTVADVSQSPEYLTMDGETCTQGAAGCIYTRTVTLTPKYPTSRSYEVSVKVEWMGANSARAVTFDTVISAIGF